MTKKPILPLVILALALSFSACGNSADNKEPEQSTEIAVETNKPAESDAVKSDDTAVNHKAEDAPTEVSYSATEEILNAAKFEHVIQIGNTVLRAPFTVQDVLDAGATPCDADFNPDYLVPAQNAEIVIFAIGNGTFSLAVVNTTDTMCSLKDTVATVYLTDCTSSSVFFPGGVSVGCSSSDLQTIWGIADSENTNNDAISYTYLDAPTKLPGSPDPVSETGNSYSAAVDRNTAKVTMINWLFR